jgi:prepilin-type N-terminal cleavage/methylation domain-containing protein
MTMTFATGTRSETHRRDAFTLVELILVMALLVMAAAIIMPAVPRFFGARAVDSEARQFMALIHYGQDRAVSEGVTMVLWVDSANRQYGLEREPGYGGQDPLAVANTLADGLKIDTARSTVKLPVANSQTGRILTGQVAQGKNKLPAIYFSPDGAVNSAMSVSGVSIQNAKDAPVWIALSGSQLSYGIQSQNPAAPRR